MRGGVILSVKVPGRTRSFLANARNLSDAAYELSREQDPVRLLVSGARQASWHAPRRSLWWLTFRFIVQSASTNVLELTTDSKLIIRPIQGYLCSNGKLGPEEGLSGLQFTKLGRCFSRPAHSRSVSTYVHVDFNRSNDMEPAVISVVWDPMTEP